MIHAHPDREHLQGKNAPKTPTSEAPIEGGKFVQYTIPLTRHWLTHSVNETRRTGRKHGLIGPGLGLGSATLVSYTALTLKESVE